MNDEMHLGETIYANLNNLVFTDDIKSIDTTKAYLKVICIEEYGPGRYPHELTNLHKIYLINFYEDGNEMREYTRGDRTISFRKGHPNGIVGVIKRKHEAIEYHIQDETIKKSLLDYLRNFMILSEP